MTVDPQTRQRLLELIYDLLPEVEAAELRRRIETDEDLARAYAEARDAAALFAEAAKLPAPTVKLEPPEDAMTTPSESSTPQTVRKIDGAAPTPRGRWAAWAALTAAVLLLLIPSVGAYWWHKRELQRIAGGRLRLMVAGPSTLPAGVPAIYTVSTTTMTGTPMPADVELALYSPDGESLLDHRERSDADGRLAVTIPADLEVPMGSRLKVLATHGKMQQPIESQLTVEPARPVTHLTLDKPLYQPGETVYYRSLTLSRFHLTADGEWPIDFEILDPAGAVVSGSQSTGMTEHGVGNGAFTIPPGAAGGEYTLVARSPDDAFPEEERPFFVRRYRLPQLKKELEFVRDSYGPGDRVQADFSALRGDGSPAAEAQLAVIATVDGREVFRQDTRADAGGALRAEFDLPEEIDRGQGQLAIVVDDGGLRETIAKTIPINLGKVEVSFYPEGGDLVAGLENRVYFVARDPLGEPVHIEAEVLDAADEWVAAVETTHEGMGSFRFTPDPGGVYRLKITTPAELDDEPKLPDVSRRQKIVLSTGTGVFAAGRPLEFNIRAAEAGTPLVAAAFCRGVPVGQQTVVTEVDEDRATGSNSVAIALPDEVGGVVRLTVYDYSTSPPEPVAERLVYRQMERRLKIHAGEYAEDYSPGEHVRIALRVTDEYDELVPAVLGVGVVDDAVLSLADDDTPSMGTHFLLTTEVEKPEDLEDADFYLSDDPEAAVALDLLLGTQGWRRFVEKSLEELETEGRTDEDLVRLAAFGGVGRPPAVFDNMAQLEPVYQEELTVHQARWDRGTDVVLVLSFFATAAVVLLVAMLGLLRIVSGIHFWVPAMGVTACCVVIGVVLLDPARVGSGTRTAIAFAPFHFEPPTPPEATPAPEATPFGRHAGVVEGAGEDGEMVGQVQVERIPDLDALIHQGPGLLRGEDDLDVPGDRREKAELANAEDLQADIRGRGARGGARGGGRGRRMGGMAAFEMDWDREVDEPMPPPGQPPFIVREYAHQHVAGPPGVRSDFTETVFWHPMLLADANGRAEIEFDLSDATGTFRLRADAHGGGRIGSGQAEVISRIPFRIEPKLPLEVSAGDRIDLPVAVINDTRGELPVRLRLEHGDLVTLAGEPDRGLTLAASGRAREHYALEVTGRKGDCELTFRGTAGQLADAVERPLRVVPPGFPREASYSGEIDGDREIVVELPDHWVPGSLEVTLSAFPSMLADLQRGMESILREPNGCFEQASTSNYPNILVMQYMDEHGVVDPAMTRRAKDLMDKGYTKLVGYECSEKGYEWFGGDPGHEALTAYGLMEFRDMARVYDVDREMLDRTAGWLLDRRDGKGSFLRNEKALDSFGRAPEDITDAYIVWALSESGQEGIEAEVRQVVELASASDDPYLIALAAAGALQGDQQEDGRRLLAKLAEVQADDGHLEGTRGSITRSGGHSLKVETTALAALAWLKSPSFTEQANRAVEWIVGSRQGSGGFGSTQGTILALKALVEHSKANHRTLAAGTLVIRRNDLQIGRHAFEAGRRESIVIDGLEADLQSGENRLTVSLTGENKLPYALDVRFRSRVPQGSDDCPVRLETSLDRQEVAAGETVGLTAELRNTTDQGQPMTIAILGLPAGLEARPDQLEELKKAGAIDYYETRAREVICYWRSLAPQRKVTIGLDLVAAVPGSYTGPASRAYLYYTAEEKQWAEPLQIEISRQ